MKLMITDQYQNMAEIIAGCMHLIENAKKACENAGVAPLVLPIRGGTDGCQLSFMGLPYTRRCKGLYFVFNPI